MISKINRRKIIDIGNTTVENVHQIAEQLDLPVVIKFSSNIQLAMYIEEPVLG
ncbi:Uncharacterised protein [uncultured archaeon]|nr:Uncharacterised protein [uncultured archaeon]